VGDKQIKKLTVQGHLPAGGLKRWKELLEMVRDRYFEIDDRVALRPDDPDLLDHADGFTGNVIKRLLELKKAGIELPEGLINPYVKISRQRVHDQADTLTKEEIIDRALMWAYGYSKEKEG
jgi:hypothetical protein